MTTVPRITRHFEAKGFARIFNSTLNRLVNVAFPGTFKDNIHPNERDQGVYGLQWRDGMTVTLKTVTVIRHPKYEEDSFFPYKEYEDCENMLFFLMQFDPEGNLLRLLIQDPTRNGWVRISMEDFLDGAEEEQFLVEEPQEVSLDLEMDLVGLEHSAEELAAEVFESLKDKLVKILKTSSA